MIEQLAELPIVNSDPAESPGSAVTQTRTDDGSELSRKPIHPFTHSPQNEEAPPLAHSSYDGILGNLLIANRLISTTQFEQAKQAQSQCREPLGSILVRMGFIDEDQLMKALATQHGIPSWDDKRDTPDENALASVPGHLCKLHRVLPVKVHGDVLILAMRNPEDMGAIDTIRNLTGKRIQPMLASEQGLLAAIEQAYGDKLGSPGTELEFAL